MSMRFKKQTHKKNKKISYIFVEKKRRRRRVRYIYKCQNIVPITLKEKSQNTILQNYNTTNCQNKNNILL